MSIRDKEVNITNTNFIANLVLGITKDVIPIVEGTSLEDLKHGVGYYQQSSFPGERGNCVLLGHRETFFNSLGELKKNDEITIETPDRNLIFRVTKIIIADWKDKQILKPTNNQKPQLILITCYPINQTAPVEKKYLVISELLE